MSTCQPTDVDEEDEGPKIKERLLALSLKWLDICCVWDCSPYWVKFQKLISLFVYDAFIELFITLCIVVNTLFMALDHHGMNEEMNRALKMGNYVIFAVFFILIYIFCLRVLSTKTKELVSGFILHSHVPMWWYY